MSAEAIRKQILASEDQTENSIVVPEWGGVALLLLSPSAKRRAAMIATFTTTETGIDGERTAEVNTQAMLPSLVIACAHDPATREPVFTEADLDSLAEKNGAVVERVGLACMVIAGKDDSSTIQSDGTGSVSQLGSPVPSAS